MVMNVRIELIQKAPIHLGQIPTASFPQILALLIDLVNSITIDYYEHKLVRQSSHYKLNVAPNPAVHYQQIIDGQDVPLIYGSIGLMPNGARTINLDPVIILKELDWEIISKLRSVLNTWHEAGDSFVPELRIVLARIKLNLNAKAMTNLLDELNKVNDDDLIAIDAKERDESFAFRMAMMPHETTLWAMDNIIEAVWDIIPSQIENEFTPGYYHDLALFPELLPFLEEQIRNHLVRRGETAKSLDIDTTIIETYLDYCQSEMRLSWFEPPADKSH